MPEFVWCPASILIHPKIKGKNVNEKVKKKSSFESETKMP